MPEMTPELSPVKRALAEIRRLRARVDELEKDSTDPIAIVGVGLRLPGGVVDEESFWSLLTEGRDAIREIPPERWDWRSCADPERAGAGAAVSRFGGFLDHPEEFDAGFFGISPREAVMMDPQHRLALEVAWEALENAGVAPAVLQGSATGIFLGIGNHDYARHAMRDADGIDAYVGSGNSPAMVAGRLSYVLGLHGPSLAIDTSCSSSLVAVHEACISLRNGDCSVALAGGVNLMLLPEAHIALSRAQMMAPDGRSKTFDDTANGYVRSEGGGIVVLKKLSAAVSDRDRILAVIRGSAINHDGRSGGLTAPSGPAQMAVIRKALEAARVQASEIGFVETHGTGTALGDPIEVEALASVLCDGRQMQHPLLLGAVKSNLGHLEAASGVVGLIKAALVLRHGVVPANLHLTKPNTRIPWDRLAVAAPQQNTAWKGRFAGVSSFGFSGTNAHVVLERAPEVQANAPDRPWHVLALSTRSDLALDTLCRHYAQVLRDGPDSVADVCFTANTGRSAFEKRLAVVARTAEEMAAGVERSAAVRSFVGTVEEEPGRVGFLFTGQGSQYREMGRELYESSEVFRGSVERCSAEWERQAGVRLVDLLYTRGDELKEALVAQPALFAVEYALAELWRSWGIEPALVLGHSLGEYVASVTAGLLSLEDGLRLVHARAELMDRLTVRGAMRAVATTGERVSRALQGMEGEVAIAAINGPESVVISGAVEAVAVAARKLESEGIRTRELEVSHAFHSPLLEPILDEFERRAAQVRFGKPRLRIVSNLTGRLATAEEMGRPRYWREHMRHTIQFHACLQTALTSGCNTFIEIGPQPHLRAMVARSNATLGDRIRASMTRNGSAYAQLCESVAQLWVEGHPVDWTAFDRGCQRSRVALPTYPFERQRYWFGPGTDEIARRVWQHGTEAAIAQAQFAPVEAKVEAFPAKWEALKKLTVAQVLTTLRQMGALPAGGEYDPDELIARSGIVAAHHRLLRSWFSLLCREGYLGQTGTRIIIPSTLEIPNLSLAWTDAEKRLEDDPYMLAYVRHCAALLEPVLLGKVSPLETLFPGGSPELAANVYEKSPASRYANAIVAEAVQAAAQAMPGGRKLRVLEVGGGTGGTTAGVLSRSSGRSVSYLFTDVSEQFLQKASSRFSAYPFLRFGLLDLENESHIEAHRNSCDIVIAANVVHATRDLHRTLEGVRELVVPGGTVILLETTQSFALHEITIGLIEGWQKSADELRQGATLISASAWNEALLTAGFESVMQAPAAGSPAEAMRMHVLLARAPQIGAVSASAPSVSQDLLWRPPVAVESAVAHAEITTRLTELPSSERAELVLQTVLEEVAQVLRLGPDGVVRKRDRLMEIGLDSLMALDLSHRLSTRCAVSDMPATLMFDYPTPEAIAEYLLRRMGYAEPAADTIEPETLFSARRLSEEEVDELSDEALEELLRSRLER